VFELHLVSHIFSYTVSYTSRTLTRMIVCKGSRGLASRRRYDVGVLFAAHQAAVVIRPGQLPNAAAWVMRAFNFNLLTPHSSRLSGHAFKLKWWPDCAILSCL
jgi:hypothetical protein